MNARRASRPASKSRSHRSRVGLRRLKIGEGERIIATVAHPPGPRGMRAMTHPDPAPKRTPLHAAHVRAGARMVPFGGWDMPVQYTGIVEEHRAVRTAVGCFDVSHMGEFEFKGPDALRALQQLTTNDVAALGIGQVQYALLCLDDGGIVDDLTLYRLSDDHYMMTVNASNIDKDWEWVRGHLDGRVDARNVSEETGLIAVQGPHAERLVSRLS